MRLQLFTLTLLISFLAADRCFGQSQQAYGGAAAQGMSDAMAAPPSPSRWWAFLVAVDDYAPEASGLQPLRYCYEDMAAVRNDWLIAAGVPAEQITILHDGAIPQRRPTKANIERELQAITSRLGPDDVLLFGAALHGVQVGQHSYLCPSDASLKTAQGGETPDKANLIALQRVFDIVAGCRAQFKLLIVDACRQALQQDEPENIASAGGPQREFVATLNRMKANTRGLAILTSCSEGQNAYEHPDEKHGAFMHAFLKGLAGNADLYAGNNDGVVTLREAANYVNRETKATMYHKFGYLQEPDLLLGERTVNFPLRVLDTTPADGVEEDDLAFMARYGETMVRWTNLGLAQEYDLGIDLLSHSVRNQPDIRENYARRAAAYRAKGEYALALTDFRKAGTTLELFIRYRDVTLAVEGSKTAPVPAGSRVSVTQIQGDWLWVTAVDNDPAKQTQGWVSRKNVVWDPGLAELALPLTPQRRRPDGAVIRRLIDTANGIAYQPPYIPTSVSLPGIPVRPGLPSPWVYVPDPRGYIPSRPVIPSPPIIPSRPAIPYWQRPVVDIPAIPSIPSWRSFLPF